MLYAAALGIWCFITLLGSDDAVAHMICLSRHHRHTWRAARAEPTAGRGYSSCRLLLACGPTVDRAGAAWHALLHRPWRSLSAVFFVGSEAHFDQPAQNFRAGADGARARGGAGRPVRYRAEQHAARPVHVRRRRPACGHEPSLQRDDGAVRRSRAARRQRVRHHRGLRQRRFDLGGERQDDPRRNRELAGARHHHDRSRLRRGTGRCPGRSSRWPAAAPSCCWKTSPSGATPKPGSAIWRATTN